MEQVDKVKNMWAHRDALVSDEVVIQKNFNFVSGSIPTKIPFSGPTPTEKFFGTFPYAYQNGVMHLGHGYTMSKLEFICRHMKLKGYNVLFPIAFHGTGMPIVACANKLKESLSKYDVNTVDMDNLPTNDQMKILYSMDVPREEIPKFINPYYWLKYFPKRSIEDLKRFGICADFTRCFVTTDMNPYYDSFVKWQFNILNSKKYLKFGKKPIIYSPKDGQSCADHDRSKGEGVNPKKYNMYLFDMKSEDPIMSKYPNLKIVITDDLIVSSNVKSVIAHANDDFVIGQYNGNNIIARPEFFRNINHQIDVPIHTFENIKGKQLHRSTVKIKDTEFKIFDSKIQGMLGSGFKILIKNKDDTASLDVHIDGIYYEPEDITISRTGDTCVVAITDQWFIDYGVPELKDKVNAYIKTHLNMYHNEAKNMIMGASEWIKEWPCSRSSGLGTKLLDTEYVIDSLSDSTIYMAYYTIANQIEKIPMEYVNDTLWNYLFKDDDMPDIPSQYVDIVVQMRNEFRYWYPVDLRVSGKDLINNHLIMCLYNHFMIWDDDKLLPKNYFTNGYIMLNNKKMSKSEGNFMTLRQAIDKYGSDPVRIALAEAGSGFDDANFMEKNANVAIVKLTIEKAWCIEMINKLVNEKNFRNDEFWEKIFEEEINQCIIDADKYYTEMEYQKAIVNGFYKMLSVRDNYRNKYESKTIQMSHYHIKKYIENFLLIVYPICPHFVEHIWNYAEHQGLVFSKTWPTNVTVNKKLIYYRDIINNIVDNYRSDIGVMIKRNTKKKTDEQCELDFTVMVTCFNKFSDYEYELVKKIKKYYDEIYVDYKSWKLIGQKLMSDIKDKSMLQNYGKFINNVQTNVTIYGYDWFTIIQDMTEFNTEILKWIPIIYNDKHITINVIVFETANEYMFKYNPSSPLIKIDMIKH
ncbi:leucyl-tRNA synthetase class IA [Fadolivirus algeromassiliense]|jgi:leucyl-tRNA synthetase|uniref:leucine--tRNA ligase n=1 Tax=Fadolivirus FV1/VV64 TaxID=3070911 RepID=A0A7D3V7A9_9VIRU|nr:leucyl-tRNA synthetase class IA [Fadolivirus algeromassiliense]QKF93616.1 leucyl-tRNA synthetase class IA [Fadolivirus FV1/VV64]